MFEKIIHAELIDVIEGAATSKLVRLLCDLSYRVFVYEKKSKKDENEKSDHIFTAKCVAHVVAIFNIYNTND